MKAEALVDLLKAQIATLNRNKGAEVGGFFFVLPPDTDQPTTNMFFGTGPMRGAFFKYLADQIGEAQKQATDPYVGVPRGIR